MSLTQYYTATTLDGFIADPENSLDWLFTRKREEDGPLNYRNFIAGIGAMAMGSTTYEWILDHEFAGKDPAEWKWPYDIPCWVFTHRQLPVVPDSRIEFTSADVASVHKEMVAAAGDRNVWIVGGGRPGRPVRRRGAPGRGHRVDRAGHAGRGCASAAAPDRTASRRAGPERRLRLREVFRRAATCLT
jgi:dihydrofolate reductase